MKKLKKRKWRCHGCKEEFYTKKECTEHIKEAHWNIISRTAGLASFRYYPEKIEEVQEESHWDKIGREQDEELKQQWRTTLRPDTTGYPDPDLGLVPKRK